MVYLWPENLNFEGGKGGYDLSLCLLRPCSELGDRQAGSGAGRAGAAPELEVGAFTWLPSPFQAGWAAEQSLSKSLLWFWNQIRNT